MKHKVGDKVRVRKDLVVGSRYGWLKEDVTYYYYPRVDNDRLYDYYKYENDDIDERFISRGLVFKTKEEAIEVAKKMLAILKEDEDDGRQTESKP